MDTLTVPKPLPNHRTHWFLSAICGCFVLVGIFLAILGEPIGWISVAFFGACLLVFLFEDKLERDDTTQKLSLWGRLIGIVASGTFAAIGVILIVADFWFGWVCAVFFGFCAVAILLDPWLPKRKPAKSHRVIITDDTIGCDYPGGEPESIRWEDVTRVVLATTSDGPWVPDMWLFFFSADDKECPIPAEAEGFDRLFDVLAAKLPGFDFEPFVTAGTDDAQYVCWERSAQL